MNEMNNSVDLDRRIAKVFLLVRDASADDAVQAKVDIETAMAEAKKLIGDVLDVVTPGPGALGMTTPDSEASQVVGHNLCVNELNANRRRLGL